MKSKSLIPKLSLSLVSVLLCLIIIEIGLRIHRAAAPPKAPPQAIPETEEGKSADAAPPKKVPIHIATNDPVLYRLNPEHPEISDQGLRNRPVKIPKPENTFRILMLGDSVAFGHAVSKEQTFPMRLEAKLKPQMPSVEVINAGVSGYTAYNELQYYLTDGRKLEPDMVMVALCLNDIVNPKLHWSFPGQVITNIPEEAIPNLEYDRAYANNTKNRIATPKESDKEAAFLDRLAIVTLVKEKIANLGTPTKVKSIPTAPARDGKPPRLKRARPRRDHNGKWQTSLTFEDALSIEAYLDEGSPELAWLEGIYDRLHEAVTEDGAELYIVILPLSYQLDAAYPFLPQTKIKAYCETRSIPCIDLLPEFRKHDSAQVFFEEKSGYFDIWHLMPFGHDLTAEVILKALTANPPFSDHTL